MSINYNVFESGLNGGTIVLTGNQLTTSSLSGNFKGFRVANQCYITSILNQDGINITSSVIYNNVLTNISGSQLNLGDIISPPNDNTYFTQITLRKYSNRSQIIAYKTGSL
jgi:hypothetical protein